MSGLYQYQGFLFDPGVVLAQMRTAYPAAGRVAAVLIYKFTGNDQYLFTTPVLVWLKLLVLRPVNQRGMLRLEFMQR